MKIKRAVLLLVLPAISFPQTSGGQGARAANFGQEIRWEVCADCSIPVWVALNSSPGPSYVPQRDIFLFVRAADFTEANLATVFTEFSTRFPEPVSLMITAFSNREMLERLIKAQPAGLLDFANTPAGNEARKLNEERYPPKTGYFRAYYSRSGNGEETFQYNPSPEVEKFVVVTLKHKTDDYYRGDVKSDLLLAATKGDVNKIRELLAQGADVNSKDFQGETPLLKAKDLETVEFLLAQGARVDDKNNYGFTALIRASDLGRTSVVQALLERGAKINSINKYGNTPLMSAAMNGHVEVVATLLKLGADKAASNNLGKTALMFARERCRAEVVRRLEAAGVLR